MVGEREREGRREDGRLRRGCERAGRTENRLRSTQQAPGGGTRRRRAGVRLCCLSGVMPPDGVYPTLVPGSHRPRDRLAPSHVALVPLLPHTAFPHRIHP